MIHILHSIYYLYTISFCFLIELPLRVISRHELPLSINELIMYYSKTIAQCPPVVQRYQQGTEGGVTGEDS